jgi:hypothetical protein
MDHAGTAHRIFKKAFVLTRPTLARQERLAAGSTARVSSSPMLHASRLMVVESNARIILANFFTILLSCRKYPSIQPMLLQETLERPALFLSRTSRLGNIAVMRGQQLAQISPLELLNHFRLHGLETSVV